MRQILIRKDLDELSGLAAELFVQIANASIADNDSFLVALAGGSTPRECYEKIASDYRTAVDWEKVWFFFGDERNVPSDDEESNYKMANEALLLPLGVDTGRVVRWPTEAGSVTAVAEIYGNTYLANHFDATGRGFDLVMLGLGADGHTASLFPHTPALNETKQLAVANWVENLGAFRFTITFPVINNASNIIFLASGEKKAQAVAAVLEGDFDPEEYPAQNVRPAAGNVYWLFDESASGLLAAP